MAKTSLLMVQIVTAQSAVIAVFYLNGFTLNNSIVMTHLGALVTWLWYTIFVNGDNSFFEASELHHCVWDLSHPKWFQSLEECSVSFFGLHFWETFTKGWSIVWCLDSDLDGFHWAESNISKEFSRSRGNKVKTSHVIVWSFFTHQVTIKVLEHFVETELACTLHRITNKGWGPAASKSLGTTFSQSDLSFGVNIGVNVRVKLKTRSTRSIKSNKWLKVNGLED